MRNLMIRRNAPLAEMDRTTRERIRRMQNMLGDPFGLGLLDPLMELAPEAFSAPMAFVPDFEVRDSPDGGLVFRADVPGVNEEDLQIEVVGNQLRISGKRELQEENQGDTWYRSERSYGSFTRTFVLPPGCDCDNIKANLDNGVLCIRVEKRPEAQARRVSLGQARPEIGQAGEPQQARPASAEQQQARPATAQTGEPAAQQAPQQKVPEKV